MTTWPVTFSLPHGLITSGITTWAVQLAQALAQADHAARLVVHSPLAGHEETQGVSVETGARLQIVRAPDLTTSEGWRASLRAYRDLTPTVLLPFPSVESYAIAAALGTTLPDRLRVVAWNHSDNPYDYGLLTFYEAIVTRYVGVSQACVAALRARLPHRAQDVCRLPYGVCLRPARDKEPLSGRPIRLVYAGRIEQANKHVLDFVRLAERLDGRGVRFTLRIVGDGPQSDELERRVAAAQPRLRPTGNELRFDPGGLPHAAMADLWDWADCSLLLSGFEGFNVAMVESMAAGCVPVVTRASGVTDIVHDGASGFTFAVGDLDAAADAIDTLCADPDRFHRMSSAARVAAEATCSYPTYLQRAAAILHDAQAAPERPWPVTRPLVMGAADHSTNPLVPADAGERLRAALAEAGRYGREPVAIFGTGGHTRALADVLADSSAEIIAFVDDDPSRQGGTLWGWPIVAPEALAGLGARTVIISSWMHEAAMTQRHAAAFAEQGVDVMPLYAVPAAVR